MDRRALRAGPMTALEAIFVAMLFAAGNHDLQVHSQRLTGQIEHGTLDVGCYDWG